jgi:hypothetical protein
MLAWRPKTAPRMALPSKIVLRADQGLPNQEIARQLGVTGATVGKWRERYRVRGMEGPCDDPRPGTPCQITDTQVEEAVTRTLEKLTTPSGDQSVEVSKMPVKKRLCDQRPVPVRSLSALRNSLEIRTRGNSRLFHHSSKWRRRLTNHNVASLRHRGRGDSADCGRAVYGAAIVEDGRGVGRAVAAARTAPWKRLHTGDAGIYGRECA